jgi:hypothetical protein
LAELNATPTTFAESGENTPKKSPPMLPPAGDAEIVARERDPGVAVKIATLDQSEQADL